MKDTFIDMIRNTDFLYGFIYECTDLINNLYDHNNYDHLVRKLCNEFVLPIINITKNEHIKEYNKHIKDTKDICSICSYLMNICSERCFKLSKDEYSKIREFMDNNIDTVESILTSIHEFFYLYKNVIIIVVVHVIVIVKKIIVNVFVLLINIVNFVEKIEIF